MPGSSPKIVGFCCQHALELAENQREGKRFSFEPVLKIVSVPCSSKATTLAIIQAFEAGVAGVFILGCPEGKCRMSDGNKRARHIVNYTKELLGEVEIDRRRLEMFEIGTPGCKDLKQAAQTMINRIEPL